MSILCRCDCYPCKEEITDPETMIHLVIQNGKKLLVAEKDVCFGCWAKVEKIIGRIVE